MVFEVKEKQLDKGCASEGQGIESMEGKEVHWSLFASCCCERKGVIVCMWPLI